MSGDQITKKCSKCGEYKPLDEFYPIHKNNSSGRFQSQCKYCKIYNRGDRGHDKKANIKYRKKNYHDLNEKEKSRSKKRVEALSDVYIRALLAKKLKCTREQVSQFPELIEFARNLIKVKRKLKEIKQNERFKQNE